ncbi:hypothetical protein [Plantactinospora sp. GCM10030261]|uniref:hypothetical protein n=1 Tax=Plantactinospora sp. GCM10030261 TaxID=3273420 RepID=UPI0036080E74
MRMMSRRWRRTSATLAAALVTALLAVLVPASAAQALPSGSGWSGSWDYYHPNAFQYAGTLPGVRLTGYATDYSGSGSTLGTIEDTAADGRCARVLIYAYGIGYTVDRTTCGSGTSQTYVNAAYNAGLLVIVYRMISGTSDYDKGFYLYIPSSASDSELRTVGTGASWSYYTATSFQFAVTRPGVRLVGYGSHQSFDQRSSLNTVTKTATTLGCASASVTGSTVTSGSTCVNGGSANFSRFDHRYNLQASACYQPTAGTQRCLPLNIPEPY